MKNLVDERPTDELHGRLLYSTEFVSKSDIVNKSILDIGCGFGWFELDALKKNCKKICGIEVSKNDLSTVVKHIKHDKASFKVGSAVDIPFDNTYFDTIVSFDVIEHIPINSEQKMFKEVARVLKKNGSFYLTTPNNSFFSKLFDPAFFLIGHRHYSVDYLIAIAKDNGFKLEKSDIRGGFWDIVSVNNLYLSKWIFRHKPFFSKFITKKVDNEYTHNGFNSLFLKFKRV